jgi:hypothetical protein
VRREVLIAGARSARELNDEALAHEVRTVCSLVRYDVFGLRWLALTLTKCCEEVSTRDE